MLREGNADIDEYAALAAFSPEFTVERVRGHMFNAFPIGTSLIAVPFVLVVDTTLDVLFRISPGLHQQVRHRVVAYVRARPLSTDPRLQESRIAWYETAPLDCVYLRQFFEVILASLLVALTAVALLRLARAHMPRGPALIVSLAFCFGTAAYSTASRGLWQHAPSMFLLTLVLLLLDAAKAKPHLAPWAALPLAFAFVVRPTQALPIAVFALYVWWHHRPWFWRFTINGLLVGVLFVLFNLHTYGCVLPTYYSPLRLSNTTHFTEALAANLVSPARGLLVYSPFLLFAVVGFVRRAHDRSAQPLEWCAATVVVLHLLVVSSFPVWWAGTAYGARFFADVIPLTIYLLLPVVPGILDRSGRPRLDGPRVAVRSMLFVVLTMFSVFANTQGAVSRAANDWNSYPENVNRHPERIWDWRDPPFLRGFW